MTTECFPNFGRFWAENRENGIKEFTKVLRTYCDLGKIHSTEGVKCYGSAGSARARKNDAPTDTLPLSLVIGRGVSDSL